MGGENFGEKIKKLLPVWIQNGHTSGEKSINPKSEHD